MLNPRIATVDDIDPIIELIKEFRSTDYLLSKIDFHRPKIEEMLRQVINGGGVSNILLVSGEPKKLKGVIGGQIFTPLWNNDKIAAELLLVSNSKFKRTTVLLIKDFEQWAKERGCTHVQIGLLKDKKSTYMNGYISMEQMFMKDLR